jgi:hypothetical protein
MTNVSWKYFLETKNEVALKLNFLRERKFPCINFKKIEIDFTSKLHMSFVGLMYLDLFNSSKQNEHFSKNVLSRNENKFDTQTKNQNNKENPPHSFKNINFEFPKEHDDLNEHVSKNFSTLKAKSTNSLVIDKPMTNLIFLNIKDNQ